MGMTFAANPLTVNIEQVNIHKYSRTMSETSGAEWLTTAEASRRLGIKRETLYAYVSRGIVRSRREVGSRESRFDPAEIRRLAGRGRWDSRVDGLELAVSSGLTLAEPGGHLYYRGLDAARLVLAASFEDVAEFLWTGELGSRASFSVPSAMLAAVRRVHAALGPGVRPIERLRGGLVLAATADPLRFGRAPEAVIATARRILGLEAAAVVPPDDVPPAPPDASLAQRLWAALTGRDGSDAELAALNAALILLADHEMASSTLAARAAASTWADPYLVVMAGLAALGGPLHGCLGDRVTLLLAEALRTGAVPVVAERLRLGESVVGFGHLIYTDRDPRAQALQPMLDAAFPGHPAIEAATEIKALVTGTFPNIDFALGTLVAAAEMVDGAGEVIFSVARSAGLLAHAIEEYGQRRRFGVKATSTGW
jgi:citrate synthase